MADFELTRKAPWSLECVGARTAGAVRPAGIRDGPVAERTFSFTQRSHELADAALSVPASRV
ncbi:hypothetical protein [Streptomyces sp. NPDC050287]|uniref:hypothetical protein n=1 Tax=Streptomyces sp. NPDC050287 TaxID=3365608 RepID=UPI0037B482A7